MRAIVIAMLLVSSVAHADSVGVVVAGEPTLQTPLVSHVKAWAKEHGRSIVDAPFATDAQQRTFVDCFLIEDIKCATGSFASTRADHVVFVRIDLVAGEAREATLTAYWFSKHHDPVAEKRACKGCDDAALRTTVGSLLDALARMMAPKKERAVGRTGLGRLGPSLLIGGGAATVAGGAAFLYYGGKGGPAEPYEYPGATKAGALMSIAGAAAVVGGALWWRAIGKRERPRYAPPALLAAGVVAVVIGGIALSYGSKKGPDEVFVYDRATSIGAPLAIAGGGALISGAMLWLFDAKGER